MATILLLTDIHLAIVNLANFYPPSLTNMKKEEPKYICEDCGKEFTAGLVSKEHPTCRECGEKIIQQFNAK